MKNNSEQLITEKFVQISFFKNRKTLDDIISEPELKKEFDEFLFPKDFSFHNPEHREIVARLYCKKNYSTKTIEGRELRNAVRKNYQEKCKDYFIEQYGWPKRVAGVVSKMVFLPNCRDHKTKAGYVASFIPAAIGGHLPLRYAEPLSRMMNVEREYLTVSSIAWDVFNLFLSGLVSYKIWKGEEHGEDPVERLYELLGLGKDVFKYMITINAAVRALEIPVRTFKYLKNKAHTYSPAALFPLNPNPVDGIPIAYLFGHDIYRKITDTTEKYNININGFKNGFRKKEMNADINNSFNLNKTEPHEKNTVSL